MTFDAHAERETACASFREHRTRRSCASRRSHLRAPWLARDRSLPLKIQRLPRCGRFDSDRAHQRHDDGDHDSMTPDTFTDAHVRSIVDAFARDLHVTPLRAHECIVAVPDEQPRRVLRRILVDELRADGLAQLARRIDRAIIPRGHVLVLGISSDGVRIFLTSVNDPSHGHDDDESDALVTRRASAVSVLGALGGGR